MIVTLDPRSNVLTEFTQMEGSRLRSENVLTESTRAERAWARQVANEVNGVNEVSVLTEI